MQNTHLTHFHEVLSFLEDSIRLHLHQFHPLPYHSFCMADVELDYERFYILLHHKSTKLAFGKNFEAWLIREFIDHPLLAQVFANLYPEYQVLSKEILEAPIYEDPTYIHYDILRYASDYDLSYWKPTTLGEILFNFWD